MSDPSSVLASIPGFSEARVLERLEGGLTSRSYVVDLGGERFVLRLDTPEAGRLGLNRRAERDVCEALANAGLGPRPLHFDAARGVYLRPYLPGRAWTPDDLRRQENLDRLAVLLRRVHALPATGAPFDPVGAAKRYADTLGTETAAGLVDQVAAAYRRIEPGATVLCHNDLVARNVLAGETVVLIDWEFAGMGDPIFDLAVVVQHHGLSDRLEEGFLTAYLGRSPTNADRHSLQCQRDFYRLLLELWNLRVAVGGGSDS